MSTLTITPPMLFVTNIGEILVRPSVRPFTHPYFCHLVFTYSNSDETLDVHIIISVAFFVLKGYFHIINMHNSIGGAMF
jgi:hypothetical protein